MSQDIYLTNCHTMNVLESILLSHRLFQLCNLSQLNLEKMTWSTVKSRFLEIYACIVLLFSIAILLQGIFMSDFNGISLDVGGKVDIIQLFGIRTVHIVCITETLFHRKEQQKLILNIQEIDRIFEISLNVDVENRKLRSKTIKNGLAMLALYIVSEFIIIFITALAQNSYFILFWILYLLPLLACGMRYFQYFLFVDIVKQRIRKLTEVLSSVNLLNTNRCWEKQKFNGKIPTTVKLIKSMDKFSKTMYREGFDLTNLIVIRDLYNRVWDTSILVNKCFGLSILVAIGVDFLAITSNFYWIFLNFKIYSSSDFGFFHIISSLFWGLPHIFNIMTVALLCHKTVETTSEIALGVHRIQIDLFNDNHNSLIEQFSLQLLHQKIQFTAFGFFTIDCSLLYTIVGATTTYLIILIQFHMSEQKDVSTTTLQTVTVNLTQ